MMISYLQNLLNTRRAAQGERGASAVEYGLLIAGIAAVIVAAVFALGPIVKKAFTDTCEGIGGTTTTCKTTTAPAPSAAI